jgi:hypothetical protein
VPKVIRVIRVIRVTRFTLDRQLRYNSDHNITLIIHHNHNYGRTKSLLHMTKSLLIISHDLIRVSPPSHVTWAASIHDNHNQMGSLHTIMWAAQCSPY